ncbi:MAG: hypothetical protein QW667_02385 [Candidatus Bathyarchaeia archaeon]
MQIKKVGKKAKRVKKGKPQIEIRKMTLEDISQVWHLGEKDLYPLKFAIHL